MNRFEFTSHNGAMLEADYLAENSTLQVLHKVVSKSVTAGVNADALLRDNLMRSISSDVGPLTPTDAATHEALEVSKGRG